MKQIEFRCEQPNKAAYFQLFSYFRQPVKMSFYDKRGFRERPSNAAGMRFENKADS